VVSQEGGGLYYNAYKDSLLSMDDVTFIENNATVRARVRRYWVTLGELAG
jgi:hypothetical protein